MTVDWVAVATIGLGSSVAAAALTQAITVLREQREHQADRQLAALAAVMAVERFGCACAEFVADTCNYHDSHGSIGKRHRALPAMRAFERNDAFKRLPLRVASMLLEFELLADQASHDPLNAPAAAHFTVAAPVFRRLGQAGFEIGRRVREQMQLGPLQSGDITQSLVFLRQDSELSDHVLAAAEGVS